MTNVKIDARLTVYTKRDDGESVPALTFVVDPRCLAYHQDLDGKVEFEVRHVVELSGERACICGQSPAKFLKAWPGVQIGDGNTQTNTFG